MQVLRRQNTWEASLAYRPDLGAPRTYAASPRFTLRSPMRAGAPGSTGSRCRTYAASPRSPQYESAPPHGRGVLSAFEVGSNPSAPPDERRRSDAREERRSLPPPTSRPRVSACVMSLCSFSSTSQIASMSCERAARKQRVPFQAERERERERERDVAVC